MRCGGRLRAISESRLRPKIADAHMTPPKSAPGDAPNVVYDEGRSARSSGRAMDGLIPACTGREIGVVYATDRPPSCVRRCWANGGRGRSVGLSTDGTDRPSARRRRSVRPPSAVKPPRQVSSGSYGRSSRASSRASRRAPRVPPATRRATQVPAAHPRSERRSRRARPCRAAL
jgi:hypothetical protein